MIFRKCSFTLPSSPSLVYEARKQVVKNLKEGELVTRDVKIEYTDKCLNSFSYLSSLCDYDSDKLQKDILCGIPLENVNTKVLNPDHLDSIDLSKVVTSYDSSVVSSETQESENVKS